MALQDTDNLIVQRGSTLNKVQIQNMSTIQDTDLLVIGRGSESYKITGQDFMDQVAPSADPPSMTGATLSGTGPGFSGETYTTTLQDYDAGNPEATLGMKARVNGTLNLVGETSPITGVSATNYPNFSISVQDTGNLYGTGPCSGTAPFPANSGYTDQNAVDLKYGANDSCIFTSSFEAGEELFAYIRLSGGEGNLVVTDKDGNTSEVPVDQWNESSWTFASLGVTSLKSLSLTGAGAANDVWFGGLSTASNPWIYDGAPNNASSTTLTLTDRKDLDNGLFQPGDVVKGEESYGFNGGTVTADKTPSGQFGSSTDPNILIDGTVDTFLHFESSGDSGLPVKFTITPSSPIPGGTTLTLFYSFGNSQLTFDNQYKPVINSVNGIDTPGFVLGEVYLSASYGSKSAVKIPFSSGTEITTFELTLPETDNAAATVYGFLVDALGETVTLFSINQSDPEMTVSGGSWSVGETVKNTVARAPEITPTTDEITGVVDNQTEMYAWQGGGLYDGSSYTGTLPTNLADLRTNGRLIATSQADVAADECMILVPSGSETGSVFSANDGTLRFAFDSPVGFYDANGNRIGGRGSYATSDATSMEWSDTDTNSDYKVYSKSAYIVFGNRGTTGSSASAGTYATLAAQQTSTTLTLATDKDLAQFSANDDVEQDSGHTPQTSAITNVVTGADPSSGTATNVSYSAYAANIPAVFNGSTSGEWAGTDNIKGTGTGSVVSNTSCLKYEFPEPLTGVTSVAVYLAASNLSTYNASATIVNGYEAGKVVSPAKDGADNSWVNGARVDVTAGLAAGVTELTSISFGTQSAGGIALTAIEVNGVILTASAPTTITLTDDTDLANFRVGDVVQEAFTPSTQVAWSSGQTTVPNWANYPGVVTYEKPAGAGATWGFNILTSSTGDNTGHIFVSDDGVNWTNSGSWFDNQHPTVLNLSNPYCRIACFGGTESDAYVATVDLIDATPPVRVTAIGPGNTLTTDGGTWNNGETVTGPDTTPATGTVASTDSAANTMTLSVSDETFPKRWIVNQGKTVVGPTGPATKVTSYLTWDNNNNVTGLSSNDPGYTPVTDLTLTFTDPAPTGQTWDQELPSGTTIETRVEATNTEGTADSGWSNTVTPRFQPVDVNPQEAFTTTALKLLTFLNRKHVYCAAQAEASRDQLIQQLAAAGYDLTEILKYL